MRWIILRFATKNLKTWEEGVFFGIAYTAALIPLMIWKYLYRVLFLQHYDSQVTEQPPIDMGILRPLQELQGLSLAEIIEFINLSHPWQVVYNFTLHWSIAPIIFNVGTSLAVLYSVRRRKLWPFLAALICNLIMSRARGVTLNQARSFFAMFDPFVVPPQLGMLIFGAMNVLPYILTALPSLGLAFYLRKIMDREEQPSS